MNLMRVDSLIEQWAERGFNQSPVRKPGTRRGITGVSLKGKAQPTSRAGALSIRSDIGRMVRRVPQVMVRISGGGRGMRHIRAHLSYITRNGKLAAIDHNGDRYEGKEDLAGLSQEMQIGGFPVPEISDRKEAINLVLSMPEGTDAEALRRAAVDFAADEFQGHQYAMVLHSYGTDPNKDPSKHPHVHLCVKARGEDGVRLNPRKHDLQRWRQRFSERLREHGIDAAASNRIERLQQQRGQKQSVLHKRARGEVMHSIGGARASGERLARARRLEHSMRHRYGELAHILAKSDNAHDRKLATALWPILSSERDDMRRSRNGPDRKIGEEREP